MANTSNGSRKREFSGQAGALLMGASGMMMSACSPVASTEPAASNAETASGPKTTTSPDQGGSPARDGVANAPLVNESGVILPASQMGRIEGEWQAHSSETNINFGAITVSNDQISIVGAGTAKLGFRGTHARLEWDETTANAAQLCDGSPPIAVEFRWRSGKNLFGIRAEDPTREWLELSFYSSTDNLGGKRNGDTGPCSRVTWSREAASAP